MDKASLAFEAHKTLVILETKKPELRDNSYWTLLRMDANERFQLEYKKQVRA